MSLAAGDKEASNLDGGEGTGLPGWMRAALAMAIVGLTGSWILWISRIIPRRSGLGHILPSVGSLDSLQILPGAWGASAVGSVLAAVALLRSPAAIKGPTMAALVGLAFISGLAAFVSPVGHHVGILGLAAVSAVLIALAAGPRSNPIEAPNGTGAHRHFDHRAAALLWVGTSIIHMIFSMHRHWAFGSGSWDHGCMVHNFYRASRFMNTTSTVLGEVDFLGDHFMVGIYLYAPFIWLDSSGYMILAIQSVNLACVAPAIYLIARHHRASVETAVALALATGLSFGLQSAAYFDSHEITVGFGFLAWGLWAFETRKFRLATIFFVLFALFKESLGAYVVALGLLAVWRGIRHRQRVSWQYGLAWIAFGAVWFILVNRVFMPALIARANLPEPHETFGDFGPTVFSAVVGIVTHPLKAFGALFVPGDKLWSHLTTFGGVGWLAIFAPDVAVAALPLFAERFLSSKATMWQMGYHYAAPLALYAGWAAARGVGSARRLTETLLVYLGGPGAAGRASLALAVYVLVAGALMNEYGYQHPANYHRWRLVYFSKPERRVTNAAAVRFVEEQGRDAKLAVQNRILPHLADRPHIYRLGQWRKADWVLLSVGENAWPWSDRYAGQVAARLNRNPEWRLVFARGGTAVFARTAVTGLPAVVATPELGLKPRTKAEPPPPAKRLDETSRSR